MLLSVLILATMALVSLAIGYFTIQEIRATRAIVLTEPAIDAAESGSEVAIWSLKRNTFLVSCQTPTATSLGNGSFVSTCRSTDGVTLNLAANKGFTFYLYDPNNINGDVDLSGFPYNSLSVTHKSGGFSVSVALVRLDGSAVGGCPIPPSACATASPGGVTQTITIPAVVSGSEGRMKVTLQSTADATVFVNTNQGMPGFPTINSTGCSAKNSLSNCLGVNNQEVYTRKIDVLIPQ